MLTKNGNVRGCKKPNSETLEGIADSALAAGIVGMRLPAAKYLTEIQENKQGATEC
ncbi:hypothetical protein PSI23_20715 [Xenorhabdus sp. XENO-10]|uniref:Uncharacterized protein n=1 Tax=Xenorhabdus yunnanensis TaxID=3025878 RepID=A0ABT5LKV4_9GAMM|nr:hypothetical protein [Xenorhabdus yunnanensis]MDC9591635.1 hypothetical protein [Xenorhabdus yunnanensis]